MRTAGSIAMNNLRNAAAAAALLTAAPAFAGEVWVVVNGNTGEVLVAGNSGEAPDWIRRNSIQRVPEGWSQIFDDDEPGWGAVACARHANGQYYFEIASGHPTEAQARSLATAAVQQHITRYSPDAKLLPGCGYAWNNSGQRIALGPSAAHPEKSAIAQGRARAGASKSARPGSRITRGSGKLYSTPIGPVANPVLVNGDRVLVPTTQPGDGRSDGKRGSKRGGSRAPDYAPGRTNALPPPAAQESSQFAPGALRCRRPEDEHNFYRTCDPAKPKPGAGKGAPGKPGSGKTGAGKGQPPAAGMELHYEAVTVCEFVPPWSRTNFWRCHGPATYTYVNFDDPRWLIQLKGGGGSNSGQGLRDLGRVGRFRVFGWSYPLSIHPDRTNDAAIIMGAPDIPTRFRYWCPHGTSKGCLLQNEAPRMTDAAWPSRRG
jgi:hypothetical protein